jgi:hypothetical protein
MTFKLAEIFRQILKNKPAKRHVINGGKMPQDEFDEAMVYLEPINLEAIVSRVQKYGQVRLYYHAKKLIEVSVTCSPILMSDCVDKIQEDLGLDYHVYGNTNLQELYIKIKN